MSPSTNEVPRCRLVDGLVDDVLVIVGRIMLRVCEEFQEWFRERFPDGAGLDEAYEALDDPAWVLFFVYQSPGTCLYSFCECARGVAISDLPAGVGLLTEMTRTNPGLLPHMGQRGHTPNPELCDVLRRVVPLELVLDAMPVNPEVV